MTHGFARLTLPLTLPLTLLVLCVACSGGPQPGPAPPHHAPVATPPPQPPSDAPITPPIASASPAPASASATAAPPPTPAPSPFSIVALGESGSLRFLPMENALFVGSSSYLAEVKGDQLVDAMSVMGPIRTTASWSMLQTMVGSWPDDAWATVEIPGGCDPPELQVVRWVKDTWKRVKNPRTAMGFGLGRWSRGSVLLLSGWFGRMKFSLASRRGGHTLPAIPATAPAIASAGGPFQPASAFPAMVALPDGHVFVHGANTDGQAMVARWSPGARDPQVELLPANCGRGQERVDVQGLVVRSGTEVYVYGSRSAAGAPGAGYLVAFDGSNWTCRDAPDVSAVLELSAGPDGSLWLVGADGERRGLWNRTAAGAWREIPMPRHDGASFMPSAVHVRGVDDVWLTGQLLPGHKPAVAHDRPAATVFTIAPEDEALRKLADYERPAAATRQCSTIFAVLYRISKVAPPDYDFPLTRKALKGHVEFAGLDFIEAELMGKRYFGTMVRSYDEGLKLLDVIKKGVKGSSPVLLCRTPYNVTRHIRFDVRTGAMLP